MKIAIVDDVAAERTLLRNRLERKLNNCNVQADLLEYKSGTDFLAAEKSQRFTVVFLDIYMAGENGIETARKLRESNTECLLVFTTTSSDHALEGFQVRAMHYLVKPFTEEAINSLMDEILSRIPQQDKYLDIKSNGSILRLPYRNIIYAEHFSHRIYIHTTSKKTLVTRQSFKIFTVPLTYDPRFFICNRGVITNLEHAADFKDDSFFMDDGSKVFVSHELLKTARQTFMEFLLQRGPV